jgi:hypothetical protein
MVDRCLDLERFMRGELTAAAFPHREHVRMGFEMLRRHDFADFDSFARANADLLDKSALSRWYPSERLATDAARRTFLLPERGL